MESMKKASVLAAEYEECLALMVSMKKSLSRPQSMKITSFSAVEYEEHGECQHLPSSKWKKGL
jgi:hypothetical protein